MLAAGDLKALRKALAADRAKSLDDPDFKEMFPVIQAMQAKNIKVTGGAVDGDTATLLATGKDGDATSHGTITMVREGGAWKVSKELEDEVRVAARSSPPCGAGFNPRCAG